MGVIQFRISDTLLKEVFGLPDEIEFCSAQIEHNGSWQILKLIIKGPDFPEVEYGAEPLMANPCYKTETQRIYRLEDWGIPKREQESNAKD